jgi:hypothetical protein
VFKRRRAVSQSQRLPLSCAVLIKLHKNSSHLSPFGVPCGLNWSQSFSSLGGCSLPSSGVCCQSPQIGCVLVTVNSVNSFNILSFFPSGSALCVSLHGASSFSNNDALFLLRQFCNLRRQFFVFFGLGISVSFLSSLADLAVSPPFGTLALDSCPLADVRSSHLF